MSSAAPPSRDDRDPGAIVTDLHQRYARRVEQFCRHRLGNREEAEDATQATFINALRGLERGASLEAESAWLFTIAHNVCLNLRRSAFRRHRVEMASAFPEHHERLGSIEAPPLDLLGLVDALQDLTDVQRRAILLREWRGLSYREIAAELELSQAAVETLLFRARRTLAAKLAEGPKRTPRARRLNLGSLLLTLKSFLCGAAPNLAATTTAAVVASSTAGYSVAPSSAEPERQHRTVAAQLQPEWLLRSSTVPGIGRAHRVDPVAAVPRGPSVPAPLPRRPAAPAQPSSVDATAGSSSVAPASPEDPPPLADAPPPASSSSAATAEAPATVGEPDPAPPAAPAAAGPDAPSAPDTATAGGAAADGASAEAPIPAPPPLGSPDPGGGSPEPSAPATIPQRPVAGREQAPHPPDEDGGRAAAADAATARPQGRATDQTRPLASPAAGISGPGIALVAAAPPPGAPAAPAAPVARARSAADAPMPAGPPKADDAAPVADAPVGAPAAPGEPAGALVAATGAPSDRPGPKAVASDDTRVAADAGGPGAPTSPATRPDTSPRAA